MRTLVAYLILAQMVSVLALAGCSGKANDPVTQTPGSVEPAYESIDLPAPPVLNGLPEPRKLPCEVDITCDGFAFARQHVTTLPRWNYLYEGQHRMRLNPQGGLADSDTAMLIFVADVSAFDHDGLLNLYWYLHHDYSDVWIGMANYTDNRWDWYRHPESAPVEYDAGLHMFHGMVWFAVVVTGNEEWVLDHIWFGETAPPVLNAVTPTNGREGEPVTLEASMQPGSGPADSWEWSVGALAEENYYYVAAPEITLQSPGNYTCRVTAGNTAGESTLYFTIVVREAWTTWEVQAVTPGFEDVISTSLALEDGYADRPHIAVGSDESIVYCRPVDGDWWDISVAASFEDQFTFTNTALAVDSSGHHYLVYGRIYDDIICYWDTGNNWLFDTLDEDNHPVESRRFRAPSIVLDYDENPHVSYKRNESADDWLSDTVLYTTCDAMIWSSPQEVASSGGLMMFPTIEPMVPITLDSANTPHIAYYDDTPQDLCFASRGGAWSDEVVNHGQATGMISLDIDTNDHAHVAYLISGQIYYSAYNGTDWDTIAVPSAANAGDWISLKLDSGDDPHIAYYQAVNQDLHMVYKDGIDWYNVRVDALGDTGKGCSLAIDNEDRAHISYHDWNSEWVKFASEPMT